MGLGLTDAKSKWNIANLLSLSRIVVTPIFLVLIFWDELWAVWSASLLFAYGAFSDYLDGHYARKYRLKSNFGALLDPLADKVLVLSVFISFVHRPLSRYVNALAGNGLVLRHMDEPAPPPGFLARTQEYADAATIPRLLLLVTEKA